MYKLTPTRGGAMGPHLQLWKGEEFLGDFYPYCPIELLDELKEILERIEP